MNLRKLAKGKPCQMRVPTVCNGNPETTVLAHVRIAGTGIGTKPPDICGIWCCSSCHDILDGRIHLANLTRDEVRAMALDGLVRTLMQIEKLT